MTFKELLDYGKETLKKAGISEWDLDAWYLLEYAGGCTRSSYFLYPERRATDLQEKQYRELIQKRSIHIPLQYLTGSQEFMGLPFCVNEHVLIPRQDTEILVETALPCIQPGMHILDLCTGSGCILLSILKLKPGVTGTGTDLSEKALDVARTNQERLNVQARFCRSDLFAQVEGKYDRILSNPPYIPDAVVDTLMEEVRDYEPRMALCGGEDGLRYYREIIEASPGFLRPAGMLFLETGYDQAEAVGALMERSFDKISVVKDLSGHDRVIYGSLKP